jgi:uncharacterized ubiquitin-like protein YukD
MLFLTVVITISCHESESDKITADWKDYKDEEIHLKIPKNWQIRKFDDVWKYFPYNDKNSKLYFSIQKYETSTIGLNDKEYLKEGFRQISEKIDKFHYVLKKLSFNNNKRCYILTIFTNEKGIDYVTYCLIYQPDDIIYDFAYKTVRDEEQDELNYRKFLLIVQGSVINGNKIIDGSTLIVDNEEKITFEEI